MSHITPRNQVTPRTIDQRMIRSSSTKRGSNVTSTGAGGGGGGTYRSLWNMANERLLIYLIDGNQFNSKHPSEIKIYPTAEKKPTFKTKISKKIENPLWEEYFYLDFIPDSLTFETVYGIVTRENLKTLDDEIVIDEWLEFKPKKEKHAEKATGKIHVRFYASSHPDVRHQRLTNELVHYYYSSWMSIIKTGDLIIYSGRGPIHESIKLATGQPYSHVGMVIKLQNKYTHKESLYILECTSNYDSMLDAFHEDKGKGICLFKLRERLHQFHGPAAWLVRMDDESSKKMDVDSLMKWVAKVHYSRTIEEFTSLGKPVLSENTSDFLRTWKISEKYFDTILDLYSPHLVLGALEASKLISPEAVSLEARQRLTTADIIKYGCFQSHKTLLFCVEASLKHHKSGIPVVTVLPDLEGLDAEDQDVLKTVASQFQAGAELIFEEGVNEEGIPLLQLSTADLLKETEEALNGSNAIANSTSFKEKH